MLQGAIERRLIHLDPTSSRLGARPDTKETSLNVVHLSYQVF